MSKSKVSYKRRKGGNRLVKMVPKCQVEERRGQRGQREVEVVASEEVSEKREGLKRLVKVYSKVKVGKCGWEESEVFSRGSSDIFPQCKLGESAGECNLVRNTDDFEKGEAGKEVDNLREAQIGFLKGKVGDR